ncbi:MAG: cytochrome c3 family protein, partial [Nitrospirota bacterium]
CYSCHAEKRGPYLWVHPPVEEDCLNCHVPHGSNHSKLLIRKPHLLCHSCHDSLGHLGDLHTSFESFKGPNTRNFFVARSCLNCHTNIHGSNGPAQRGSHFLR